MEEKKQKFEYESVKLSEEELSSVVFQADDSRVKVLNQKNKIDAIKYRIDNEIARKATVKKLADSKKELSNLKKELKKLNSEDEDFDEKEMLLNYDILMLSGSIEEQKLEVKLNLPMRSMNTVLKMAEKDLVTLEWNLKSLENMRRNKTERKVKQRKQIQLSDKVKN